MTHSAAPHHPPAPPTPANGQSHDPLPTLPDLPPPPGSPTGSPPKSRPAPGRSRRRRGWLIPLGLFAAVLAAGGVTAVLVAPKFLAAKRPDVLLHKVRHEPLPIAVVEKGTLESAENRDVICHVKAGSKGTYASTIKWVIDDGTPVHKGQLLVELDDSALQDNYKNQSISVEKAKAEFVTADENYRITAKQNEADIAAAASALKVAELDLDKFLGFRVETSLNAYGAVAGMPATLVEKGEYKKQLDDASALLKQAESDLEAMKERSAWAERSVKLGYLTPSQAKVETTKYDGGKDNVEKLGKAKYILETFQRQRDLTDLKSKQDVARIGLDKAVLQAKSKEIQADSERKTKLSVYLQEVEKLKEIDEQIAECKLHSPQDGMVVYYKPDSGRFSQTQQGLIAQGEQVKEGQKLMRIPNPRKMQVNTRVHEALVSRVRGDELRPTGYLDAHRAAMLTLTDPFARLLTQSEFAIGATREVVRGKFRMPEYVVTKKGQRATIRLDAFPNRVFDGRVKSVAAVASQTDWMSSDVRVYQTLVLIDSPYRDEDEETAARDVEYDKLKPDMNAEVTIIVDGPAEPVLAVPIQAVIGGAEAGPKRTLYVMTPTGPQERDVVLGKFNDKLIEVQSGIQEGDEVVINPKVLLGDKAKTREEGQDSPKARGGMPGGGEGGGEKKGGKGEKKGGKGGGKGPGGPPAG